MIVNTRWAMYMSDRSAENTIGFHIEDALHPQDVARYRCIADGTIVQYDQIRLLFAFDVNEGTDPQTVWEDLKLSSSDKEHVERVAFVGDETVSDWMDEEFAETNSLELRYFRPEQYDDAWNWLGQE